MQNRKLKSHRSLGFSTFVWAVLSLATALVSYAHPGGSDSLGCHQDKAAGNYHCHKGALAGKTFASKAEAEQFLAAQSPVQPEPKADVPLSQKAAEPASDTNHSLVVMSWNVKHMGRKELDLDTVATLVAGADIATFQEVDTTNRGQDSLKEIALKLRDKLNQRICWGLSEIPSGSTERYAYIWRDTRIAYVKTNDEIVETCPDTAITIRLGVKNEDKIVREPAFGTFLAKATRTKFILASIHLVPSGKSPQKEVEPLFDTFKDVAGPIIVAGDFNLDARHPIFSSAKELGFAAALIGEKTSLKMKARELNKAYDNFWYKDFKVKNYRVLNLYEALPNMEPHEIYKNISDHSPIEGTFDF